MAELRDYLQMAVDRNASDIFIVAGGPVGIKCGGKILPADDIRLMPQMTEELIKAVYEFAHRDLDKLRETGDDDFSFAVGGMARFRVNAYQQRGSLAAVIRIVSFSIPDYKQLGIPENRTQQQNFKLLALKVQ